MQTMERKTTLKMQKKNVMALAKPVHIVYAMIAIRIAYARMLCRHSLICVLCGGKDSDNEPTFCTISLYVRRDARTHMLVCFKHLVTVQYTTHTYPSHMSTFIFVAFLKMSFSFVLLWRPNNWLTIFFHFFSCLNGKKPNTQQNAWA